MGTGGCRLRPRLICAPWSTFEFFPGRPSTVLFVQTGSCKILAAELPLQGPPAADVHLFGQHKGVLMCNCKCCLQSKVIGLHASFGERMTHASS